MDTRTFARGFGAVALVVGPATVALGSLLESSSDSAADDMVWVQQHPTAVAVSTWVGLGTLLMVPAMLVLMRLARRGSPVLGLVGGSIATTAWFAGLVAVAPQSTLVEYASRLPDRAGAVGLVNAVADDPATGLLTLVFVAGHLIGMLLLGIALYRARTVPRWAAVVVAASPVLHVATFALSPVAEAAVYLVLTVATAACGLAVLRTSNDRWDVEPTPRTPAPAEPALSVATLRA